MRFPAQLTGQSDKDLESLQKFLRSAPNKLVGWQLALVIDNTLAIVAQMQEQRAEMQREHAALASDLADLASELRQHMQEDHG